MSNDMLPIKIDVGAKLEVKTEIPPDASGRIAHAVADSVSPLTEWLGMMGDKIRIHRRLVVAETIARAEKQLEASQKLPHPVPTKIVVPLLEQASQEEPNDDVMINMWANLLAAAAEESNRVSPRFVSILGEINGRQAQLLKDMIGSKPYSPYDIEAFFALYVQNNFLEHWTTSKKSAEEIRSERGLHPIRVIIVDKKSLNVLPVDNNFLDFHLDIEILESLSLIRRHSFHKEMQRHRVTITYWLLSPLGVELLSLVERRRF